MTDIGKGISPYSHKNTPVHCMDGPINPVTDSPSPGKKDEEETTNENESVNSTESKHTPDPLSSTQPDYRQIL